MDTGRLTTSAFPPLRKSRPIHFLTMRAFWSIRRELADYIAHRSPWILFLLAYAATAYLFEAPIMLSVGALSLSILGFVSLIDSVISDWADSIGKKKSEILARHL